MSFHPDLLKPLADGIDTAATAVLSHQLDRALTHLDATGDLAREPVPDVASLAANSGALICRLLHDDLGMAGRIQFANAWAPANSAALYAAKMGTSEVEFDLGNVGAACMRMLEALRLPDGVAGLNANRRAAVEARALFLNVPANRRARLRTPRHGVGSPPFFWGEFQPVLSVLETAPADQRLKVLEPLAEQAASRQDHTAYVGVSLHALAALIELGHIDHGATLLATAILLGDPLVPRGA